MPFKNKWSHVAVLALALALGACGGGDADEQAADQGPQSAELIAQSARNTPRLNAPVSIGLQSDPGDYIGNGRSYQYTKASSLIGIAYSNGLVQVSVHGNETWNGTFQIPRAPAKLRAVRVGNAPRGAMSWFGEGRGCNTSTGSFSVANVVYVGAILKSFDLSFDQHCEGNAAALHGLIHFNADDNTSPSGPIAVPPGLWTPPANVIPSSGRSIYLESQAGDYVGGGQTYLYTQANATLSMNASSAHAGFSVSGNEWWSGDFQAMQGLAQLQPGYYGNLQRYPFNNPATGGLDWSGQGRGCNTLTGWFVVDDVSYNNGALSSIRLRFEQHCEGATAALHGQIVWTATDSTAPGGPVYPPPAGLWSPPQGAVPSTGRSIYLESDAGDYVGAGRMYLYTQANASLSTTSNAGHVQFNVNGDTSWSGDFQAMSALTQLKPGYYGNLQRYPFNNAAIGGLSWSGSGRGCNTLTGWFVVDEVTYNNGSLSSITLRFEQHCEGAAAALHGQITWTATDSTAPPGPAPDPGNLWSPPQGAVPDSGRSIYLESDAGDYIGAGQKYLYTLANATLSMNSSTGHVQFGVTGDKWWSGDFQAMSTQTQLQPGYYGNLERYPFNNPVTGGLNWGGDGRGCNTLTGWFIVDSVTYNSGAISSIKLRFEQHCEGGAPALHGQVTWTATDSTAPPGAGSDPGNLWQADPGAVPASGNYVYLKSDTGDYIGHGGTYLYTAGYTVNASGNHVGLSMFTFSDWWYGDFAGPNTQTQLQPGYYANLTRYPFNNPVTGGLSWYGNGRGCNTLTGWFIIDSISYVNGAIKSVQLRFEQHCEGGTTALRGQIHWTVP